MWHFYFCNINFIINIYLNVHTIYFICGFLIIFIFVSSTQTYPGQPLSFPITLTQSWREVQQLVQQLQKKLQNHLKRKKMKSRWITTSSPIPLYELEFCLLSCMGVELGPSH